MSKVYFEGPLFWAKVFEGNMDTGEYAPEGGQYTVQIGLNEDDAKQVMSWNRMYLGKEIEGYPGLKFFTFKRKNEVYKRDGSLIQEWSGPPKVLNLDGSEWEGGLIGNGSIGVIKLDVNQGKVRGKPATFVRLEVVAIKELVEYKAPVNDDDDEDEDQMPKGKKVAAGKRPF